MENKTTTELLELLHEAPKEKEKCYDEFWSSGGKYEQIMAELESREPFLQILGKDWDTSIPALFEKIELLEEEVKKLKRHKHDKNSGDVLIRI
jgi:predicted AlkP superfamily phosphohydrolase/phosphomutase